MKDVQETLDRLVPEPERMSDWEAVLREAKARRRSLTLQLAAATGIIALAALFAVAPWKGSERELSFFVQPLLLCSVASKLAVPETECDSAETKR